MLTTLMFFAVAAVAVAQSVQTLPLAAPMTQGDVTLMLLPVIIPGGIGLPGVPSGGEALSEVIGVLTTADPQTAEFVVTAKFIGATADKQTITITVPRAWGALPTNFVLMVAPEKITSISILEHKPVAIFGN